MCSAPAVHAQSAARTPPASPKFEVVSIKPANPDPDAMFGVRHMPGGGINAANVTLKLLIKNAYGLQDFQLSGGPGWIESARYNIEAKPDSPVNADASAPSLFTALQEQLGLKLEPQKAQAEIFVIDRAEKPSEN
jgi:hypothetical protein